MCQLSESGSSICQLLLFFCFLNTHSICFRSFSLTVGFCSNKQLPTLPSKISLESQKSRWSTMESPAKTLVQAQGD